MGILILNDIYGYDEEIKEFKIALKQTKNIGLYKRYSVVLRDFEGFTNKLIAEMEGLEPHAVGNYIRNYKLKGLAGLEMKYSPGPTKKLSKEQEDKMIEVITNNTHNEVGFESRKN